MERVTETLGDLYGMHWPYKQHNTSRNQRLLPYHNELKKAGACFGVSGEYERPMWYALSEKNPEYKYSFGYQNWYPSVEFETKNTITALIIKTGIHQLNMKAKIQLKMLVCLSFLLFQNMKLRVRVLTMNFKDCVLQILKMI